MAAAIQTTLIKNVALPLYRLAYTRFEANATRAQDIQNRFLLQHIKRCARTQYGVDHELADVKTIDDFKNKVPISGHKDLEPYFSAVGKGHSQALFPESDQVICFSSTTGTTGEPKLIPVTRRWLSGYQRSWEIWGIKLFVDHPELFDGIRSLQITGPSDLGMTPCGLPIGMASSLMARYQHPLVKPYFPVPARVGDIKDATARYYTILRITLPEPIGFIATIMPSNLLMLGQTSDRHSQSLIRDIHDGTFNSALFEKWALPDSLATKLKKKKPKRARALERIIEKTGTLYPKDFWRVSLISCWLGGTVGYQSRLLETYYGSAARRDLGFVSTEGRHTIVLEDDSPVGLLSFDSGSYYEFVPVDEFGTSDAAVLDGSALRDGADYRILVTSTNGLWRYDLGDIVRCRGRFGSAPMLEFLSKTKDVCDMEGEKLSGDQIAVAIREGCEAVQQFFEFATFVPMRPHDGAPYYGVVVEEQDLAGGPVAERFLAAVDRSLVAQNVMYAGKRNDGFVGRPRVVTIPAGSWAKLIFMQTARRQTGSTQYKHPPLATDTEWIEDLRCVAHLDRNLVAACA